MSELKQCCACCGNRYEDGGGCDCERNIQRIAELQAWVNDLLSGMYVNCVYCGHRYGPDPGTPVAMADVLKAHIEQCPKHPMSAMKRERDEAQAALAEEQKVDAKIQEIIGKYMEDAKRAEDALAEERELSNALDNLCTAYRLRRSVSGKTLDKIEEIRAKRTGRSVTDEARRKL